MRPTEFGRNEIRLPESVSMVAPYVEQILFHRRVGEFGKENHQETVGVSLRIKKQGVESI